MSIALQNGPARQSGAPRPTPHMSFVSFDALLQEIHDRMTRAGAATGPDPFVVQIPWMGVPPGHETLSTMAAHGLPWIAPADLAAMIAGVRSVDTAKLSNHFKPSQQRRHVLRAHKCQSQPEALCQARHHLRRLHRAALAAPARAQKFQFIGEALHLIQDSFSQAHASRSGGGTGPILYIRYYRLDGLPYPQEHRVLPMRAPGQIIPRPIDPRDYIGASGPAGGALIPPARQAVRMSRAFLRLVGRHLATLPPPPRMRRELTGFMNRFLVLHPSHTPTKTLYPGCP